MQVLLRRAAVLSAVAVLAPPLAAQRNVPSTYAITNARLVPVNAPAIEKGTIVIRDGLIAAIGAGVAVPADARIIDGTGLTVYPGLFDSFGTIGMARPAAAGAGGGGAAAALAALSAPAAAPTASRNGNGLSFDSPRGVEPDLRAADQVRLDEDALDGPRSAGITTALTAPGTGIFQGQSALINLGGSSAAAMIVRPNVAQQVAFASGGRGGGGGGYPGSLMGVFAVIRQQLLDAQRYRDIKTAYDRNPKGMSRPEFDPSLDALLPALAKQQPVVMVANSQREIERALDLAREFGLRVIIAGGAEANLVADRLKAENVPVLLSLNFPRRTAAPTPDAEPEPTRVLRERVEYPKTAGRLAASGVKFAFESGGLTTWTDFNLNVQRAIEAGLSADQALKALTWQPAEIFGVSDRLGSLEVGKIANLTITKGDMADKASRVSQLFVDGKPIALHPATPAAGAGFGGRGGAAPAPPQASGHKDDNNPEIR
ncbi:MAG: amidohydrolase family protein [Gemmatimonadaceae bacterium]